ncbi:MAG: alpha-1,4-glucan--maltose-1-phosphate maltosyltransferase [Nitrospiraceae bacterium]|nr:MAG: alpha-1,4-glucan--maltose-1-phosphate maltosyltransferase [Nitrospiraceae bacterium]
MNDGRKRVVIENVKPEIDGGRYPVKRVVGEAVTVTADIFTDGHDSISASLLYRRDSESGWKESPMKFISNDSWHGEFTVEQAGKYYYTVRAWIDHFTTWQKDLKKRVDAGQDLRVPLLVGSGFIRKALNTASGEDKKRLAAIINILEKTPVTDASASVALGNELGVLMARYPQIELASLYVRELEVTVDVRKGGFSSWYERFPRSCSPEPGRHGTFRDCEALLPEIARMGFDVFYLPPVHPIGVTDRKGKNNSPKAEPDDVGSPWAIGSAEGGHKSIHPQLGTIEDFERLVFKARDLGIDIAMDLAFQCSPDHPYVKEHPEWFTLRPDGTIQYAENPPKKYQDIFPLNFETDQWKELWEELRSVVQFWIDRGVRIFRVDNPHTKPFPFWEWLITGIKKDHPEVIFLAEAFTRPKVMYELARIGFTQSYTYFTWRNTKGEFMDYITELFNTDVREYFRPNFWPNTPDILPEHLQYGGRPVHIIRLILAATLSPNYGIYGPVFELCSSDAIQAREEYLHSEKYEVRHWDWDSPGNLKDLIARINQIRRENPALQSPWNLTFYESENNFILFYGKVTKDLSSIILVAVNLDPYHTQSGWVHVPIKELGIDPSQPYLVHDLLGDDKFIWHGEKNFVELNPQVLPGSIFMLRRRLKRESDFDYFM